MTAVTTGNYKSDSVKGIRNRVLQKALANLQNRFGKGTAKAYRQLPEGPDLRLKAHGIRKESIENLDILLEDILTEVDMYGELRFKSCWERLQSGSLYQPVYLRLIEVYAEKQRAYHTLTHIVSGLSLLHRVSDKLTDPGAVEIAKGKRDSLALGNLNASRDWGHSKDYVRAMHMITNHEEAGNWVVATGESRTIREMCEVTFNALGLDYQDYVTVDPKYFRPQELDFLKGDSSEIREKLGWQPEYTFESMVQEMVDHWMRIID